MGMGFFGARARRGLVAIGVLLALAGPARAEPVAEIDALYEEAKGDLKEGRFPFALDKFRRGIVLAGDDHQQRWRMTLGVALAYEKMGQLEYTVEQYRDFLSSYAGHPEAGGGVWEKRRKVVEDQVVLFEQRLLESRGALSVQSQPEGARVIVDGAALGSQGAARTPWTAFLAPGDHELKLQADGYQATSMRVFVEAGSRRSLTLPLEPEVRVGLLTVRTGADDAVAFVDARRVGEGAEVRVEIEEGWHAVKVTRPGYTAFEQEVQVDAERPALLVATLTPSGAQIDGAVAVVEQGGAARLAPLWGWIGVGTGGALLATGAVFTVLAKKDSDSLGALDKDIAADPTLLADPGIKSRYDSLKSGVQRNQIVAGVVYGLGGAAAAGSAVYLIFFADWDAPPVSAGLPLLPLGGTLSLEPTLPAGVSARWTW